MKPTGVRQQPGFACEECRRRKSRCDRERPQCGSCVESGTVCTIVDKRPQRGPKKGQLNMMRSRIVMLESQLAQQEQQAGSSYEPSGTNYAAALPALPMSEEMMTELEHSLNVNMDDVSDNYLAQGGVGWTNSDLACVTTSASSAIMSTGSDTAGLSSWGECPEVESVLAVPDTMSTMLAKPLEVGGGASAPIMLGGCDFSDLMWADLWLYFDRVHPVCPMIHRRRYFAWAGQDSLTVAQTCLRLAMRTMAAAASAQYRGLVKVLYAETRRMLEAHVVTSEVAAVGELMACDSVPLEQIQAWLLLAHYESLRMDEQQAMLTARRAFRLVQMAHLYDVDAADDVPPPVPAEPELLDDSFVDAEEKRRTFWLAFTFDRFLCWRNDVLSPWAECIVLATLHGRCMAHRRASEKEAGRDGCGFWMHHETLVSAVEKRLMMLRQSQPSPAVEYDPMLLFAHMLAHSSILHLSGTVQRTPWQTAQQQLMTHASEQRASRAAAEIVRLAKAVPSLSSFNAHYFLPNPLASAANFLITHANLNEGDDESIEHLLRLLRKLRATRYYLLLAD
ncbi:hypothetical protein DV738_g1893, partial [Chaetothyriales sp. CBS 135597]